MGIGVVVTAEPGAGETESLVGGSLGGPVAKPLGSGQGDPLKSGPVVPAAPGIQEPRYRPRDLPRVGVEAGLERPSSAGHQHLVLGLEPGQGLPGGADLLRLHPCQERP
jgi:hypothetical protein